MNKIRTAARLRDIAKRITDELSGTPDDDQRMKDIVYLEKTAERLHPLENPIGTFKWKKTTEEDLTFWHLVKPKFNVEIVLYGDSLFQVQGEDVEGLERKGFKTLRAAQQAVEKILKSV